MKFTPTPLAGAWLIEPELLTDERGFFARTWCRREFEQHGLTAGLAQCNISFTQRKGTIRGLHFQRPPHAEAKLVRCTAGAIYDVIVDLRPDSPTLHHWFAAELSAENRRLLFAPADFAHGFQTLTDNAEVAYQMSAFYEPEAASGVRWDDPALAITWPLPLAAISGRDAAWPLLGAAARRGR